MNLAKGPSEPLVLHQIFSVGFAQKSISVSYSDAQLLCSSVSRVSRLHYCIVGDSNLCRWLVPDLCIASPAAAGFYIANTFLLPVLYTHSVCSVNAIQVAACLVLSSAPWTSFILHQAEIQLESPLSSWKSTFSPLSCIS